MIQKEGALKGVKIIDFCWVVLGPLVCKILGDYGAEVVKVETHSRPDIIRTMMPFARGKPGVNRSGMFSQVNSSKYSLAVNLNHPKGIDIFKQLVLWADVLVENFTPGQMTKWGLNYEEIEKIKPDIIMLSLSIQGQTGPYANQPGLGNFFQGMVGFNHLTGWPGQEPQCPYTPYPDFITAWYALVAVMGALDYRRRTGKGQHLDVCQLDTSAHFLTPAVLDHVANGRAQGRIGNRLSCAAPHGVYRCKGEDKWCAIGVFTDKEWQTFCEVMGSKTLANNPRFASILGRKKNESELDDIIEAWTVNHPPKKVMELLQAVGIAAGVVQSNADICEDINLRQRGFLQTLSHSEMGPCTFARPSFVLSENPPVMSPSPCLGEHTEYICKEILHLSDSEFLELLEEGILE